jgi:hypothetical protein
MAQALSMTEDRRSPKAAPEMAPHKARKAANPEEPSLGCQMEPSTKPAAALSRAITITLIWNTFAIRLSLMSAVHPLDATE